MTEGPIAPSTENFVAGLIWHFDCMKLAAEKIVAFVPPANLFDMRMYHSLYLVNLLSATELAIEQFGAQFANELNAALDTPGQEPGNNYSYLRELRNAVIHRGEDLAAQSIVIAGVNCVIAPQNSTSRKGGKAYRRFAQLLREMFALCDERVGPIIEKYAKELPMPSADELRGKVIAGVRTAESVPVEHLQIFLGSLNEIPFEELTTIHSEQLTQRLTPLVPSILRMQVSGR